MQDREHRTKDGTEKSCLFEQVKMSRTTRASTFDKLNKLVK